MTQKRTERVRQLEAELLRVIGPASEAKTTHMIEREVRGKYTSDEYTLAVNELIGAGKVEFMNGWFYKAGTNPRVRGPPPTTGNDDADWVLGIGRYAQ